MPKPAKKVTAFIKGSGPGGAITEAEALAHNKRVDAFEAKIAEAQYEIYQEIFENDEVQDAIHTKAYDMLTDLYAIRPGMYEMPVSRGLEYLYERILDPILLDPKKNPVTLLGACKIALQTLSTIAGGEGDIPFWNKGGDGYETVTMLRKVLETLDKS